MTKVALVVLALMSAGCETEILTRAARANLASFITDVVSEAVDASINSQ